MRDFLDVRDVVEAYCAVLRRGGFTSRQTFNIGSGTVRPVSDLLDALLSMSLVPIRVEQDPDRMRASEVPRAEVDITKIREKTGWMPRYTLRDTVATVLNDCRRRHGVNIAIDDSLLY